MNKHTIRIFFHLFAPLFFFITARADVHLGSPFGEHMVMVVAIDNADPKDPGNIHPKNKQEIGRRLALAAEAIAYKQRVVYSGPLFEKMKVESNKVRLYFKNTGSGLLLKTDSSLNGFAIAGSDKKFVHADAAIDGNTIVVWSNSITGPVAVRYAWAKNPPASLYNNEGLPASPFKTDN